MMKTCAWWLSVFAALATARELDPAACASRFDVQKDKIIRTEESREMGARYLSELDVGTRLECLRLCCETDSCDVFVYEEKGLGSCYLFNCGPPEDFRCKFTSHSNFSSGVLALSRRLAELQDQERLAHHEQELANLRVLTTTTTPQPTTSTTTPAPRPSPPPVQPPDPPRTRCSRYQFECHTSGECIAVYNACDGVPQCADASDEAPELGCPAAPPLEPVTQTTTTTKAPIKLAQEPREPAIEQSESREASEAHWPHRLAQAQPPRHFAEAPASHIFSHKGGLLQEPENIPISTNMGNQYPPPFEAPWQQRRPWMQPPAQGMEGMSERGWSGNYPHYEWSEPDPRRAWPVPQRPEQVMSAYMPPKTMPETAAAAAFPAQHELHDSPKKGFDLTRAETPAPPKPKPEEKEVLVESTSKKKELKVEPSTAHPPPAAASPPPAPAASHTHDFTDEHDGSSDAPAAALMLLILGVLMTSATGLMLACRARAVRRRRRGKSYAHDADYLVNGMYL